MVHASTNTLYASKCLFYRQPTSKKEVFMKSRIVTAGLFLTSFILGAGCGPNGSDDTGDAAALGGASEQNTTGSSNTGGIGGGQAEVGVANVGAGGTSAGSSGATDGASGSNAGAGGATAGASGINAGAGGTTAGTGGINAGAGGTTAGTGGSNTGTGGEGFVDGEADSGASMGTCLEGTGDFSDKGPYTVQTKVVTIGDKGQYTIFYPSPLESNCPHPIVAWGNGTFITGGTAYAHFNEHMASWGIVAIASHNSNVGDGTFQTAAIDYLLAQNKDSTSEFFGKLSTKAGVTGHSQGGRGSDAASTHANVEATGNLQGSFGSPPGGDVAFLCLTGTEDLRPDDCPSAVSIASTPAMAASYDGMDHLSTVFNATAPGTIQYARLLSAWFRCFLADDTNACAMFKGGANCPICNESGWAQIFSNNY